MSDDWRDFFTFDYYDLSNDEAAWQLTTLDEDDEVALRHARFRPLGVVRAVLRARSSRKITSQIWVSEDGHVMVDGGAELATLFEDGSIVKTNRRPAWSFFDRVAWQIRSHPSDRHPHVLVDGSFSDRLAVHREQIARFQKESPVVVADSMTHHFAARMRDAELRISRQRPEEIIVVFVTGILSMAFALTCMMAWRIGHPGRHVWMAVAAMVLLILGFLIAAIPIGKAMSTWVAPWLVRLRPGPPPRPAATWIELARKVPRGTIDET